MSRGSIHELVASQRGRYQASGKVERGRILDELVALTGYHRKALIRRLHAKPVAGLERRGRRATYGLAEQAALRQVWAASDQLCGKRLAPFLPTWVAKLEAHGELALAPTVRAKLVQMSAATIDRLVGPRPADRRAVGLTQTGALAAVRAQVPLRTWQEWANVPPGHCQADLVAHCGETTEGFYLTTLTLVDVATSWTDLEIIWGKGQQRVGTGLHHLRERLPFPLTDLHTDNGGEFLNQLVLPYCRREGIRQTRGRPDRQNDQAWVEQKNGLVVRRAVGYDRYSTRAAYALFQQLYQALRWQVNFFQPVRRLVSKERVGAKVVKRFDQAQTPYQRLLASGALTKRDQRWLAQAYEQLNPLALRRTIEQTLEQLWAAADPLPRSAATVPR